MVSTEEGLDFFFKGHGRLDVEFAFFQAKSSPRFSAASIGTFMDGIEQFFKTVMKLNAYLPFTPEIRQKVELTRSIYEQSIKMHKNPKCSAYYVTTGKWTGAPEPRGRIRDGQSRLENVVW